MKDFIFISGNQKKADYLTKWLGRPIEHRAVDVDEIQSLDVRAVAEHKVRQAYAVAGRPVLVEDISLAFTAMGALPGTFIKWFLQEMQVDGLCKLAAALPDQRAVASICYAWYDGQDMHFFEQQTPGTIAPAPRGANDFGWGPVFIPDGSTRTYAEMTDKELETFSIRAQAIVKLRAFLEGA